MRYCTLRGLRSQLRSQGVDDSKYVSIFGLRTHGSLKEGLATEQIYIHSKAMVVDDEVALVGSSNVNDRSLLGMRDSEVNVVIDGRCCGELRKALFAQHLGLKSMEGFEDLRSEKVRMDGESWKNI